MEDVIQGQSSKPASPSPRRYRSRRSRPCDRCRKGKQLCLIPVHGKPCGGCMARKQPCTFDLPPVRRHRPSEEGKSDKEAGSRITFAEETPELQQVDLAPKATSTLFPGTADLTWSLPADESPHLYSSTHRQRTDTMLSLDFPRLSEPGIKSASTEHPDIPSERDLWQTLFRPDDQSSGNDSTRPTISLDLEAGEGVESHFLGTGTFRGLTLREINNATSSIPNRPGMVQFRQVSADETNPVYFVRHPSLQYGQAPENGKAAWDKVTSLCSHLGNGTLSQALSILRSTVLHTLPIINYPQFEQACRGVDGSGPIPYALLAATMAHAASYIPSLRPLHQPLWAYVVNALDAEFRQPKLFTLQLALIILSSRPGVNFAQSDITLSRAIGVLHVLGLHLDPSNWSLPNWERSLRRRLFWTALYHDKFRALLLGRPSALQEDNYSTPLPTVEDARWVEEGQPAVLTDEHQTSLEAFVANCRLVPIVDRILKGFMTVKSTQQTATYMTRVSLLDSIRNDLNQVEQSLSTRLRRLPRNGTLVLPTGVSSFQLTLLGMKTLLHRIELDILDRNCSEHILSTVFHSALSAASDVVLLVLELTVSDRSLFWMPYTFHHMSNAGSLLLRIAAECRTYDIFLSNRAIELAKTYCQTLAAYWRDEQWDMADETLKRLAEPAFTVGKDCTGAREIYITISEALGYPVNDTAWDDMTVNQHFGFINDGFDPSIWTIEGVPWLSM